MSDTPIVLSTLAPTQRQRYLNYYNFWIAIEQACEQMLTARVTNPSGQPAAPINSYSFNGGQGMQSTSRMSLKELSEAITLAANMATHYAQKIHGRGLMSHMIRRR